MAVQPQQQTSLSYWVSVDHPVFGTSNTGNLYRVRSPFYEAELWVKDVWWAADSQEVTVKSTSTSKAGKQTVKLKASGCCDAG